MTPLLRARPSFIVLAAAIALAAAPAAWSATPAPIPVTVTAPVPFVANVFINIAGGTSGGSDNGNVYPGTQTFAIPAGKMLVVQSLSVYSSGSTPAGSTIQCFLNTSLNGTYSAIALPVMTKSSGVYVGSTVQVTTYADANGRGLVNAFRDTTSGSETLVATVVGYLVNAQ